MAYGDIIRYTPKNPRYKYVSESYRGYEVLFRNNGRVVMAQVPRITNQYLGVGNTKEEAFEETKIYIDKRMSSLGKKAANSIDTTWMGE